MSVKLVAQVFIPDIWPWDIFVYCFVTSLGEQRKSVLPLQMKKEM